MKNANVIISRAWSDPKIEVQLRVISNPEGIALFMPLESFILELAAAVGNPAMLMTRAALLARLQAAADQITSEMKGETARVM